MLCLQLLGFCTSVLLNEVCVKCTLKIWQLYLETSLNCLFIVFFLLVSLVNRQGKKEQGDWRHTACLAVTGRGWYRTSARRDSNLVSRCGPRPPRGGQPRLTPHSDVTSLWVSREWELCRAMRVAETLDKLIILDLVFQPYNMAACMNVIRNLQPGSNQLNKFFRFGFRFHQWYTAVVPVWVVW